MNKERLLKQLDNAWIAFKESYTGLTEADLIRRGVSGNWSVRDIIAHVTVWENEALKYLPTIMKGDRPPRYSVLYGGIDAFNAEMTKQNGALSLSEILQQSERTHRQLVRYIQKTPEEQFTSETRFRRRLRLDTYSHYPKHTGAIRKWRKKSGT